MVNKPFIQTLNGKNQARPPFWFMRQAGRYLPEYREIRKNADGFLDMVYSPNRAIEVTMQPLRRYNMDAAILFSDILVIPHALGINVDFVAGEGPKLTPLKSEKDIPQINDNHFNSTLEPIYKIVSGLKQKLIDENFHKTALIGFAGSPWTVACYMVEGSGSKDFQKARYWAYNNPNEFQKLIDILIDATSRYLIEQINHGAKAIQLFDSWSGLLDERGFHDWCIAPTAAIVKQIKAVHPHIPIIGFPRGAGDFYEIYARQTNITALSLDQNISLEHAQRLQKICPVQGNLDPVRLLIGGTQMDNQAKKIISVLGEGPFIFNLGHGVIKETPPEHLNRLTEIIRND